MKKIVFIAAAFMIASTLSTGAQILSFGAKAGININTANLDRIFDGGRLAAGNNPAGYHFGLMGRIKIPLTGLHIQPEALINSNNTRFVFSNMVTSAQTADARFGVRRTELMFPILAGFKFAFFRFNAGPVFTFNLSDKETAGTTNQEVIIGELGKRRTGYQIGVGVDLLSLTLDVRYNGNFGRTVGTFFKSQGFGPSPISSEEIRFRKGQVMFSVGYMF